MIPVDEVAEGARGIMESEQRHLHEHCEATVDFEEDSDSSTPSLTSNSTAQDEATKLDIESAVLKDPNSRSIYLREHTGDAESNMFQKAHGEISARRMQSLGATKNRKQDEIEMTRFERIKFVDNIMKARARRKAL